MSSLRYVDQCFNEFNENPTHLSLLSYDLVGLIYYLSLKTNLSNLNKLVINLLKKKKINKVINKNNLYYKKNTIKNIISVLKKINISELKRIKNFNDIKFYEH